MAVIIPQVVSASEDRASGAKILGGSLRFNSVSSHYLNRTPASAGNRRTFTWSGWAKLSLLQNHVLFSAGTANNARTLFYFDSSNGQLYFFTNASGTITGIFTSAYYRDVSAWYHVVLSVDTTQATASNRAKIYINGVEQTVSNYVGAISQNADLYINATNAHGIGAQNFGTTIYSNGYLTEINFVDGYAYDPSYFGFTDPLTNTWRPKKYTGEYGTNGFYLPLDDDNAKGTDRSGKGNNWTANNFSGTSTSPDVVPDSPSGISYSTVPTVGIGTTTGLTKPSNYCTLNSVSPLASGTLSNGDLSLSTGFADAIAVGTIAVSSGKWYWEITATNVNASKSAIGIIGQPPASLTVDLRTPSNGYCYISDATKGNNNATSAYGAAYVSGDVIGVALDLDAGTLVFFKNNSSQGTAFSSLSGTFSPAISDLASSLSGAVFDCNFGQRPFKYTPPTGFLPLCTANLPRPTIVRPDKFVGIVTWTATGTDPVVISSLGFSPDLVWAKARNDSYNHVFVDQVRGVNNVLSSNNTNAEASYTTVTQFNSNGFSAGGTTNNNYSLNCTVTVPRTYVAWCWKAGGPIGVGRSFMINDVGFATAGDAGMNTGTVAPTSASVNTKSGFSIVTYTGNGSNTRTIDHGLGVAPSFYITKNRDGYNNSNGFFDWNVYHKGITGTNATTGGPIQAFLMSSGAAASGAGGICAAPTSTVFSPAINAYDNVSTKTYVAYLWSEVAGFSKFGSYTGNGSSDGPFVFCGFRPRWLMIKRSDSTESWLIFDTARETYNPTDDVLWANLFNAESANYTPQDFTSNGFKIRTSSTSTNASGGTYIFIAYAESPAQNLFGGQSSAR